MATSDFHLWQFQILKSGAEGLVVVLFWLGPVRDFLFAHTRVWTGDLWISSPALYHRATVISGFHLCQLSGIELWCRGIGGGNVLIGPVRDFLFAHTRVWTGDLWISSPALYHCATATSGFHLWDWWWYCSDWTCERFYFCPHQGLNWGPLDL